MRSSAYILFCFSLFFLFSFRADSNRIFWSEQRDLEWEDYQGNPDYSDDFRDAVTASAINFKTRCNHDNSLDVLITAQFVKDQSWFKPQAFTDYHLNHERLHFHITELYVRKFREAIQGKQLQCDDLELVEKLGQHYMDEWRKAQIEYDTETKYSLDRKQQKIWADSILLLLEETNHLAD